MRTLVIRDEFKHIMPKAPTISKPDRKLPKKLKKLAKELQKELKDNAQSKQCKGFMHESRANIVLSQPTFGQYASIKGPVKRKVVARIMKESDPEYVLINAGLNSYRKITYKTYKKLSKLLFVRLRVRMDSHEDGEDEPFTTYDHTYRITSLNHFFYILNRREGLIEYVRTYTSNLGWYTMFELTEKMDILYKDGSVEKISLDKFLERYDLYA